MKAIGDKLILKRKMFETMSSGGIHLGTDDRPKPMPNHGIIVAVGKDAKKAIGGTEKLKGKTVLFTNGVITEIDGEEHLLISLDNLYGVL